MVLQDRAPQSGTARTLSLATHERPEPAGPRCTTFGLGPYLESDMTPKDQSLPRLLSTRAVMELTSFSRGTLYLKTRNGTFPKPLKIGARRIAYREPDVRSWLEARPTVR